MRRGLRTLHRLRRRRGEDNAEQRQTVSRRLLAAAAATLRQVNRIHQVLQPVSEHERPTARRLIAQIDQYGPLLRRVIHQAQRRVLEGQPVPAHEKVMRLFEPHTRIIPRHKGGATVEFGRLLVVDEVEGGSVTRFAVLEDQTGEQGPLAPAPAHHQLFRHAPRLVTGDRGLHAPENEHLAGEAGVAQLVIPRSGAVSATQRAKEHSRPWRRRSRWRAGIAGRLSSLRREYGLRRCPAHGEAELVRHVGWGVIASNLRHIGQRLVAEPRWRATVQPHRRLDCPSHQIAAATSAT